MQVTARELHIAHVLETREVPIGGTGLRRGMCASFVLDDRANYLVERCANANSSLIPLL
jgi:hypothetical protein